MTTILKNGQVVRASGEIAPFAIDLRAATHIYEQIVACVARHTNRDVFSTVSWSPEAERRARQRGRHSPEFINIHTDYRTSALMADLAALGFAPMILVQKHDWWVEDRYARMNDSEQMDFDLRALDAGFHLSGAQVRRLVAAGRWTDAQARAYAPYYETEA